MFELKLGEVEYPLNFGIGFLRDINKTVKAKIQGWNGVTQDVGFRYHLANMLEGSYDSLEEIILCGNKGKEPKITREILDNYFEDENTNNDEIFEKVLDFLQNAVVTKKLALELGGVAKKQEEPQN